MVKLSKISVGLIHDIPTVKEAVDSIINGALEIEERLGSVLSGKD